MYIEVMCFLKLFANHGQVLVLIDCRLRSIMKRLYNKYLINLVRSVITKNISDLGLDILTSLSDNK